MGILYWRRRAPSDQYNRRVEDLTDLADPIGHYFTGWLPHPLSCTGYERTGRSVVHGLSSNVFHASEAQ
jgi:hypothetical protein